MAVGQRTVDIATGRMDIRHRVRPPRRLSWSALPVETPFWTTCGCSISPRRAIGSSGSVYHLVVGTSA